MTPSPRARPARHYWKVQVSQAKTKRDGRPVRVSVTLVGKNASEKRQLKRLRQAFESGMRMVVGHGIKGGPYLLWSFEVPDGTWRDGKYVQD